jgi:uncharacterized protein (TIGR03643 family)
MTKKLVALDEVTLGEVIDMALSDHVSFTAIKDLYGFDENQVKQIMRAHLRPNRYRAWRARVQTFGDRRDTYKHDAPAANRRSSKRVDDVESTIAADDMAELEPPIRRSHPSKRSLANP